MNESTSWDGAVSATEYPVYHGVWTNWSRGHIMGATLTLSRTDGNYLLSFTALFISLVSARFWYILCFIAHTKFSTPQPRDALHHQRQAILRNSASPLSSLWTLCQLVWTWRRVADRLLARAMPVIFTAILCAAAFTLAGGFSSQLSTGISNEVLLDGSRCGIVDASGHSGNAVLSYSTTQVFNAANYAQQCYSVNTSRAFDCTRFVQPTLTSVIDRNATCPFENGICRSNVSNIYLDTGHIDTSKVLGINSPENQRILFRSTLQCAPLITDNHSRNVTLPSGNFTRYYYGPSILFEDQNFTFQAPDLNSQYPEVIEEHTRERGKRLQVAQIHAFYLNGTIDSASDFNPIPELSRDDGDLSIVFLLANGVRYTEKAIDPWYRGTIPSKFKFQSVNTPDMPLQMAYSPEEAASPLGCLQRYQICNVDASHCGPLKGYFDYQEQSAIFFNISKDSIKKDGWAENNPAGQRFEWFTGIMAFAGSNQLTNSLSQLGAFSLSSQTAMNGGLMAALAENQWQLDVEHWWAIGLANMQAGMVDVAVGPSKEDLEPYTIRPPSSHIQDSFCNSQKILSTKSTSFSLFGIYFIYVVGTIIIAISYLLEPLQNLLYRRKKISGYACLEWATTESLQLQRAAYQGIGTGTWTGHFDAIPVTKSDELMGDLPHTCDNEPGSSFLAQAKPGVEKVEPVTMPRRPTNTTLNDPNVPVGEGNDHCRNGAEQKFPTVLPAGTRHSGESSRPEEASGLRDEFVPPLAATLPPVGQVERPALREVRADIASQSGPPYGRKGSA